MDPATIALITQLVQLGIMQAPQLAEEGQTAIDLMTSGAAPTEEQLATIRAGLDKADQALKAAIAYRASMNPGNPSGGTTAG